MAKDIDGLMGFISGVEQHVVADKTLRRSANHFHELGFDINEFRKLCAKAFRIEDKSTNAMQVWGPLLLANKPQLMLVSKIMDALEAGGQARFLVLKNRKVGASTAIEMVLLGMAMLCPGITCAIIAHTDESSSKLFSIIRTAYEHLSPDIKKQRPLRYNSESRLQFGNKDLDKIAAGDLGHTAIIKSQTASGQYPLTGDTVRVLHLSECAKYDAVGDYDAQQRFILSAMGSVPKSGPSLVICETTANGATGFFHSEWVRATNDERVGGVQWVPIFISWLQDPSCSAPVPEGYNWAKWYHDDRMTEHELVETFKATPEQLFFRRSIIQLEMAGTPELYDQEFPTTAASAFLASGRPAVPRRFVKAMETKLSDDYEKYMAKIVDGFNQQLTYSIEGEA